MPANQELLARAAKLELVAELLRRLVSRRTRLLVEGPEIVRGARRDRDGDKGKWDNPATSLG
jgi:hypothetical protein